MNIARTSATFKGSPSSATRSDLDSLAVELGTSPVAPGATTNSSQSDSPFALRLVVRPGHQGDPAYTSGSQVGFDGIPLLPEKLVRAVDKAPPNGPPLFVWTRMPVGLVGAPVPGLLAGAKFGSVYELFYFFPLTAEQQTIGLIQRTLLLVGIATVFLLAAIAWLVTRWVVIPVRQAAHGAWRLSAGHLNERMEVRGTDELAALATSFNEMAASLQEKLEELEDLSQVQRQFVSDVSHELRTPLTTIRIAADVLFGTRDQMDPAVGRSAELLQSQLERFESLLTDLLEISRYDANAATLDAEPADIGSIVRQSADVAQQLAERRGSRIEFRLPAETCIAEVDRRRVERILRNLLQNAVEHGENKDIVVTAEADSAAVAVSVRDFGVGLRARRGSAGLRPVLAGRPGQGPDVRRHRARPGHRAGGRAAARRLARGLGRAWPGLRLPGDVAAPRGWRPARVSATAESRRDRRAASGLPGGTRASGPGRRGCS